MKYYEINHDTLSGICVGIDWSEKTKKYICLRNSNKPCTERNCPILKKLKEIKP